MIRRQAPGMLGLLTADIPWYFFSPYEAEVLSRRSMALLRPSRDVRRQSSTRTFEPLKLSLSRPRQQLLLLLTKVPAAQSQGEEVVILGLVKDLLPHLLRELIQTPSVLDLPRVAVDLLPGSGAARDRRSLSLRHLPSLRDDVFKVKKLALARSFDRSQVRSSALVLGLPFPRREGRLARRCRSTALPGLSTRGCSKNDSQALSNRWTRKQARREYRQAKEDHSDHERDGRRERRRVRLQASYHQLIHQTNRQARLNCIHHCWKCNPN